MTIQRIALITAAALAAACATGGGGSPAGGPPARIKQADHAPLGSPGNPKSLLGDETQMAYWQDGLTFQARGIEAQRSGNMDQARAEYSEAAKVFAKFADNFASSDWALRIRFSAADLFMEARQFEEAAAQGLKVQNDRFAAPVTKALASKLVANAWLSAANSAMRAGKLEPVKFTLADQRGGKPPEPRVPPGEWKKFVDAADTYLGFCDADPDAKRAPGERQSSPPSFYAQFAGEVLFGFDNMLEARKRFDQVLTRWPGEAEFVGKAIPLYLQSYLVLGDVAGHDEQVDRLRAQVQAAASKASEGQKPVYAKILTDLDNASAAKQFGVAQRLLEEGKFAEAAAGFEALAADPRGGDAPNALHNAAIAYDKAGQKDKAAAIRVRIVSEFPDSKIAPMNQFQLAQRASEAKKFDDSVKLYKEFLERWPSDRNRCAALQNVASALDNAKKIPEAAQASYTFGADPECAKGHPDVVAMALFRSGELFDRAKNKAKAKEAYQAAAAVNGVTNVVAKSQQDEAKRRAKR